MVSLDNVLVPIDTILIDFVISTMKSWAKKVYIPQTCKKNQMAQTLLKEILWLLENLAA